MWWIAAAVAAPRFVSTAPETVTYAEAAWAAATECTGRAPTIPQVDLVFDLPLLDGAGLAGQAKFEEGKPATIRLAPRASVLTLAHEIAHAWVHEGPTALVEGRTEILAQCIRNRRPEVFPGLFDRGSTLERMPELTTWTHGGDIDRELDAYLASFRFFRAVAGIVPPEQLWAEGVRTWEALDTLLKAAGPKGMLAHDALHGGVEAQRAAVLDEDFDGMSTLEEGFLGFDPTRRDTDGDGWWDGAPTDRVPWAQPLPPTRNGVCLPAVPRGKDSVVVRMGGALGGLEIPAINGATSAGGLVTWESGWERFPGGVWIAPVGEDLVANARCAMRPNVVVRSNDPMPDGALERFANRYVEIRDALIARGVTVPHAQVTVRGTRPYAEWTGSELLAPTTITDDPERFAGTFAVMSATASLPSHLRVPATVALLAEVADGERTALLSGPTYAIAAWTKAAKRCATGWDGLIRGTCPRPE